jgi:hypothetical protein
MLVFALLRKKKICNLYITHQYVTVMQSSQCMFETGCTKYVWPGLDCSDKYGSASDLLLFAVIVMLRVRIGFYFLDLFFLPFMLT